LPRSESCAGFQVKSNSRAAEKRRPPHTHQIAFLGGVGGSAQSSLLQRKLICFRGGALGVAFFTRAYIPQKLPGINAQLVAVIPVKLDGVFAYALGRQGLGCLLEHGEGAGREFRPLTGLAARLATFVVTQGAGAGIAQEGKRVVRAVAILPLDVQA
jgi:hypothetical protein